MGELIGYIIKNGVVVFNHKFYKQVSNQAEIEAERQKIISDYTKRGHKDFEIEFMTRQLPRTGLKG